MKAFKSLKAYKYFSDHSVLNVWATSEEGEDIVVVRGYCHSSLKSQTTCTVYVVLKTSGDVLAAQCKCVAGKGEACNHIAALLFYIEDIKRRSIMHLPSDRTATDCLQMACASKEKHSTPASVQHGIS